MEAYVNGIIYILEANPLEGVTLDIDEEIFLVSTRTIKHARTNFAGVLLSKQKIIALDGETYTARIKQGSIEIILGPRKYKCTIVPSAQKVAGVCAGVNGDEYVEVDSAVRPAYIIAGDNVYNIISMRRPITVPRLIVAGLGLTGVYAAFGIVQAVRSLWT